MGRTARSAWIIRLFALALGAAMPLHAEAAASAQGVALDASADCSRGDLDLTLSTAGANRESWLATNVGGRDARPRRSRNRSRQLQRHVHRVPDRAGGISRHATGQHADRLLRVRRRNASQRGEYRRVLRLLQLHDARGSVFVLGRLWQLPADRAAPPPRSRRRASRRRVRWRCTLTALLVAAAGAFALSRQRG